jgi:CrcB protein
MKQIMIVGLGGFAGSVLRFKLSGLVFHHTANWKFPLSTVLVNLCGCLAAGLLAGLVEKYDFFTADTRLFLFIGLLGGFTTFSAFGMETVYLIQRHEFPSAALNIFVSVCFGILALWIGLKATT